MTHTAFRPGFVSVFAAARRVVAGVAGRGRSAAA